MNPADLLISFKQAGIEFNVDNGKLLVRGALTDKMRELIRQHKEEIIAELLRRERVASKVIMFPYPINETLGIGSCDPLDIRYVDGKPVLEPGGGGI